mgnify:CR=1 FL=1
MWSYDIYRILFSYLITLSIFQILYFLERKTMQSKNKIGKNFASLKIILKAGIRCDEVAAYLATIRIWRNFWYTGYTHDRPPGTG